MGYQRTFDQPQQATQPPCLHLRSKAIYVTGNPDPVDSSEVGSERFHCWCNLTQHVLGADDELVERVACVEGRKCYCPRGG